MGEEVPDGERPPVIGKLRDVGANRVVEIEPAIPCQENHRRGGELLRDRSRLEDGLGRDRRPVLEIRHPIAALKEHRPIPAHPNRAPGRVGRIPGSEDRVGQRREVGSPRLARRRLAGDEPEEQDCAGRPGGAFHEIKGEELRGGRGVAPRHATSRAPKLEEGARERKSARRLRALARPRRRR